MGRTTKKAVKKDTNQDFLQFWDEDGKKIEHDYLIPASVEKDGKSYANISFNVRFSKQKDTLGVVLELGDTGKEMYIGASTKKLGRVFISNPKAQEGKVETVVPTVL